MTRGSTLFLRVVLGLIALAVLAFCILVLPLAIGSIDLGGYDPILLGMYISALPFLFALYQTWQLLDFIDQDKAFSEHSVKSLNNIKYSAIAITALYIIEAPYIFHVAQLDDAPGVVLICLIIIGAAIVVATFAAVLQKLLRSVIDIKSENDLTV